MRLLHIVFLLFYIHVTMPLMRENKKGNLTSLLNRDLYADLTRPPVGFLQDGRHLPIPQGIQRKGRKSAPFKNPYNEEWGILTKLRRRKQGKGSHPSVRRSYKRHRRKYSSETARESSTSVEMAAWKKEFDEDWVRLKKEAVAIKMNSSPHGDVIHMMAARPWTAPCGDPQQHDWAWGSCTLAYQCDGEYRIYRGDIFCGRSSLVCCSVQHTTHDLYQGFDLSFEDTESDSSDEKRKLDLGSKQISKDKKRRDRVRRWRKRKRAKRFIKKKIRKLVHHLRKILNRAFRNTTIGRRKKVQELTRLIKKMKSKFRHERNVAKQKFGNEIEVLHTDLYKKLIQLDSVNAHFLVNETFREFLKRYNISGSELRALNPEVLAYLATRTTLSEGLIRLLLAARSNLGMDLQNKSKPLKASSQKKVLRTLNEEDEKKIKDASEYLLGDVNASGNLSKNHDSNLLPSLKFEINPSAETAVSGSLPLTENSTTLGEMYTELQSYIETDKKISESAKQDTRRSGTSFIFERKKHQKKPKRKDYLEYDIEYGALYL